jgi:large subunit ribosomal protein L1
MAKKGKKYQEAASKVDRTQHYSVEEAIKCNTTAPRICWSFLRVSIPKRNATSTEASKLAMLVSQQIRGAVVLPNGTGKSQSVLVFAKGDKIAEAEAAGADYVGELLQFQF